MRHALALVGLAPLLLACDDGYPNTDGEAWALAVTFCVLFICAAVVACRLFGPPE